MNPVLVEETIEEMVNALGIINNDSNELKPRMTPRGDFQFHRVFAPSAGPPVTTQYSIRPGVSSTIDPTSACWHTSDCEIMSSYRSEEVLHHRRPSSRSGMSSPHPGRRVSFGSRHRQSWSSTASSGSYIPGMSPFPAPSAPLPALPSSTRSSQRMSSQTSTFDSPSFEADRFSQSSASSSHPSRSSFQSLQLRPPPPLARRQLLLRSDQPIPSALHVAYNKKLMAEKRKNNGVFYLDISTPGSTVATKHGNSSIKFWNVESGIVQSTVKFSSYTEARCRSRDYLIRSHAILSDSSKLAAIATRFGRSIEIWNWEKRKKLQLIDEADRWAAGRFESYDSGWSPLAAYRGEDAVIDLYAATNRDKKPFAKVRTIDLRKSGLPFIPQYPELAISPTSPLLVAASGPRTPRAGRPPPDREVLLVAWEIHDYRDVTNEPHRVVRPSQHKEIDTAIPCSLLTYGNLVVSIWIPANHRVVTQTATNSELEYKLTANTVRFKHVLVWDLSENSTRSYSIPNTMACISPDCRFLAYCDVAERRNKLAILDATTGDELWFVGGEGNLKSLENFADLSTVTELAFSADGKALAISDMEGNTTIYDVRELMR